MPSQVISSIYSDGPTLTAAARASALPTYAPSTLPAGYWQVGRIWRITASGRISNAVTTPGNFRFDLAMATVAVADTLAILGNIVAKTNVHYFLDGLLTCRSAGSGTSATLMHQWRLTTEAIILTAVPTTGPGGGYALPWNTAPAVGAGFNSQAANAWDFYYTHTLATASQTLHQFVVEQLTP